MTHRLVWSAHMIELAAVVTARLHDHPRKGRDEGMHRHPDIRAAPPPRARNEAHVHRADSPDRRARHALTNQVHSSDVGDMLDVCFVAPDLRAKARTGLAGSRNVP
jgi:hypothetical protein